MDVLPAHPIPGVGSPLGGYQLSEATAGGSRTGSKKGVTSVEDDFAFIEKLLDNLQCDGDGQPIVTEPLVESPSESSFQAGAADLCESLALGSAPARQGNADLGDGGETWGALLTHFCESGDETIVDSLLDKFLRSTSDATNLLDAIDRGMPKRHGAHGTSVKAEKKNAHLHLQLDHVHRDERLDSWDALLSSARGLLHSARTTSARSTHSARSPCSLVAGTEASLAPCPPVSSSVAAGSVVAEACMSNRASSSQMPSGNAVGITATVEGESAALPSARSASASHVQDDSFEGASDGLALCPEEELRARLAGIDDPEIMRGFMKKFLIGIRRRCLNEQRQNEANDRANDDSDHSDNEGEEETDEEDTDDDKTPSVWTCRSVGTCSVEPSVVDQERDQD